MSGIVVRKLRIDLERGDFVRALAYLWCATSMACSEVRPTEPTAQSHSALIGGSLSPTERDAVVFMRANYPDGSFADCTGTLLSPHVVITAKHCVTLLQPGEFVCNGAGTLVQNGQGGGLFGAKVDGSRIEVYTGTAPVGAAAARVLATFASESGDACHDDIAAIVLDTPIPQDTYPMLRVVRPVRVGETVRLVGYGTVGHETLVERRELADVRVTDVGRDDGVLDPNANTPARAFVVGGATACFGDSGGPALSMATGALMGVYSRITGDCFAVESRNDFILAASFVDLFARAFSQAGEEPSLEPDLAATEDPVGAADSGATAGVGGSGTTTTGDPSTASLAGEQKRHDALRCSVGRSKEGVGSLLTAWLLLALAASFSRRYFGRRPS
jgi:hypothetical protein